MNAIIYNITHHTSSATINSVCAAIAERKYTEAEHRLVDIIERMVTRTYSNPNQISRMITLLEILYSEFNTYYLLWAQHNGKDEMKEIEQLISKSHGNFLLAHCTDSESMDDLLYETNQYLTNLKNEHQKKEATYHLECYKRLIVT